MLVPWCWYKMPSISRTFSMIDTNTVAGCTLPTVKIKAKYTSRGEFFYLPYYIPSSWLRFASLNCSSLLIDRKMYWRLFVFIYTGGNQQQQQPKPHSVYTGRGEKKKIYFRFWLKYYGNYVSALKWPLFLIFLRREKRSTIYHE